MKCIILTRNCNISKSWRSLQAQFCPLKDSQKLVIPVEPDFVRTSYGESPFPISKYCELLTSAFNYDPLHYPIPCTRRSLVILEEPEAQPSEICVRKLLCSWGYTCGGTRLGIEVKVVQPESLLPMLVVKNWWILLATKTSQTLKSFFKLCQECLWYEPDPI